MEAAAAGAEGHAEAGAEVVIAAESGDGFAR
jgi:hypothetical protein